MARILYIDDEPTLLTLTRLYLKEEADLDVDIADSAEEGLEKLKTENFDAIISDYDMPGIDGIELLKMVRDEKPSIPFIIFTGKGREEVVIDALNNGADFYLQKGGDPKPLFTELAHAVRHLIRRSKAEDSAIKNEKYWNTVRSTITEQLEMIDTVTIALLQVHSEDRRAGEFVTEIRNHVATIREELNNSTNIKGDDFL